MQQTDSRERDNDGSCSAENSRVTQRSSEGARGERVSQKLQQSDNDSHNRSEMKKIEIYTAVIRKPRLHKITKRETRTHNRTLEIERTARSMKITSA